MVKNFLLENTKEIICIIPARFGSKGIKNKNIIKINGKRLINYTIDTAIKLNEYCDIIISTDSKKILSVCNNKKFLIFNGLRPKNYQIQKL